MVMLLLVLGAAAVGFYFYQQGLFQKQAILVEQALENICDPEKEDCSGLEDDLEV
jgi:uncharacterized protein (DUF2164 family)